MPRKFVKSVWLIVILLSALSNAFAQITPERIALVIGNRGYRSPNDLMLPSADAARMTNALQKLGFEVISGVNLNKRQTEEMIAKFGDKLAQNRGVGLVYYTGIGFRSNGENYLVPVDADFTNEEQTVKTSVSLNTVTAKIRSANNKLNLILLDAVHKTPFQSIWRNRAPDPKTVGFGKVSPEPGTIVFYSAQDGRTAIEKCGRNGYFVSAFMKHIDKPKIDFATLSRRVSEEIRRNSNGEQNPSVEGFQTKPFYLFDGNVAPRRRGDAGGSSDLSYLFESFKANSKCPCGQREDSINLGKEIIKKFANDRLNDGVIEFIKTKLGNLEKEEKTCKIDNSFTKAFKEKNWAEVFRIGKLIIAKEGDSGKALDVKLDLVSIGYDRAVVEKIDTFNRETLILAKSALAAVSAGKPSNSRKYGAFVPFNTRADAQGWLNYIIGWLLMNRMNQPKEALPYFYKAAQSGAKKNDVTIYTTLGKYYYDQTMRLDAEYREKRAANNNSESDETKALSGLARAYADRALDAFGRAYAIALKSPTTKSLAESLKKTLDELYRFRFNKSPDGFEIYFENLISQPLPDPSSIPEAVLK